MEQKTKKHRKYKILRTIGKILIGFMVLFLLLILFIRSKWGQDIIVNKVVSYVSEKTKTKVEIDELYVTFGGNIMLNGLYLEDTKGDTLVYSKSLEANMPLWPIIRGKGIGVDYLGWQDLTLNIIRKDSIEGYNFQFLADAFTTADTTAIKSDTISTPLDIIIGKIDLAKFDITFNDAVLGINSRFVIGNLSIGMDKIDVKKMDFRASEINLSNATVKFFQSPVTLLAPEEPSILPFLSVGELSLTNVVADYQSKVDNNNFYVNIAHLITEIPKIDIANNAIEVIKFDLNDSEIAINTATNSKTIVEINKDTIKVSEPFEWPDFNIKVDNLDLRNNILRYAKNNAVAENGIFNSDAIFLTKLNLKGSNIFIADKKIGLNIEKFSFNEASGMHLKQLVLNANASDNSINVDNVKFTLNDNRLQGNLKVSYNSLTSFIEKPDNAELSINIPFFQLDLTSMYSFQPDLRKNELLQSLSKNYFKGNLEASGKLSSLIIPDVKVNWGTETQLSLNGKLQNITKVDQLQFDIPQINAQINKQSLLLFVNEDSLGINLPEFISLKGNVKGSLKDINTKAQLITSQGNINLDGHFKNNHQLVFDAILKVENYEVGKILNNNKLGNLTLSITTNGKGKTINELDADLLATVEEFGLNNYEINGLKIEGNFNKGTGNIKSDYKDKNLNLNLASNIVLDSITTEASVNLNIIGADMQALGITETNFRTGFKLNADFKGNSEKFNIAANIEDGVVVQNDKSYLLGGFKAKAFVDTDTTSATLINKILNFELHSNASPEKFTEAIQRHISSYFYRDVVLSDTLTSPVNVVLKGRISKAPILDEVFLVKLRDLDTIDVDVNFKEKSRNLTANITAPHINYGGSEIDSLAFSMETGLDKFIFDLGFKEINSGPLSIKKTIIKGNQKNNELDIDFVSYHENEKLINIQSSITGSRDSIRFHVLSDNLILNKNKWQTPENNEILITKNKLNFNDFIFSLNDESIEIKDVISNSGNDRIDIDFNNFKLNKILNYLNPEEEIASGVLDGALSIDNPFDQLGVIANLDIKQLNFLNVDLGIMSIDAKSKAANSYDFAVGLKGGQIDLDIIGDYLADETEPLINLDLAINRFNMLALEGFTSNEVSNASGYLSGIFKLNGNLNKPTYSGQLKFTNANFKITQLNESFTLDNDILIIDNKGLSMNNFTIQDENKNTFTLSGNIGTESFTNPTFNVGINANNFQVINATKEDNELIYGKAIFDANGKLSGTLEVPKLEINLKVSPETDITYVLPSSTVNIEQRDGVVIFVNRENSDAILTRTEEKTATVTGFDINANLTIGNGAKVKIIIDEETNDNFQISGTGAFNLKMKPNGILNLTGKYEVKSGHYEMNLYNLVNRRFDLKPGSTVSWYGDPFDAKLDISAIYQLETSASALMASQVSGSDPSVKNKFRQVLPFYVYLNIDGELMQPEISFNLDMPEAEQGAIGGQVYGRVQQINQQENDLNQQVFSLLVLNKFYPEPGSDGSSGGIASIAKDNLNDAISDQLNVFSNKLLGQTGVELDFGLDSYTDYQGNSPQERTQLDIAAKKKLFNDRLIVSVGSEVDIEGSSSEDEPTPLIGNVSLEYLLTENGRYRLKGFRKNEFENVIDGQTVVSGIALIFTQEFNKFDELWSAILGGGKKNEKDNKEIEKNELNNKK